ncbi:uncharacterized protein LOC110433411 isoform X2 [Sorghum bicolor]|uniref:uncharacterized protein LOC110433411 isoform X2 n=1 Tax=Sorghum bicolor TaxID=4558 RepID=UPI000B424470|nr:uncharacterized protein LOC110433411 isoform X2 [Sorghum bicolor]|eukprot:XP_021311153.1 uncharacterized protein LOC110433411 isoform X2 [Sorghum bicolor]
MQFLDGMWMGGSSTQQLDLLSLAIDPWIDPCEAWFTNAVLRPVTPKPTPLHPSPSMAAIFSTSDHGVSPSLESTSRGPASTTAATASPEVYRHHQSRRNTLRGDQRHHHLAPPGEEGAAVAHQLLKSSSGPSSATSIQQIGIKAVTCHLGVCYQLQSYKYWRQSTSRSCVGTCTKKLCS